MKLPKMLRRRAIGGVITGPPPRTDGQVVAQLSRGEAYVPRAEVDECRLARAAMTNPGTHVFIIEADGSITDTEA